VDIVYTLMIHNIVFDILILIVPKDIIEQIIFQYINDPYKYRINTPVLCTDFHYNKQLNIIYCGSTTSNKLIDYHTGKSHDSSKINISMFKCYFSRTIHKDFIRNIICFDNNDMIAYSHARGFSHHVLQYGTYLIHSQNNKIYEYKNVHVYNQHIYVCCGYDKYHIEVYDAKYVRYIVQSRDFNTMQNNNPSQMTIHDNTLYICEHKSESLYNIISHNIHTLDQIDYRTFNLDHKVMTIYKNMIYTYEPNKLHIYDIQTLNKLYTFSTRPFENHNDYYKYCIKISNGILMISNDREIQIYDLE
jgi:hypothetical protein